MVVLGENKTKSAANMERGKSIILMIC